MSLQMQYFESEESTEHGPNGRMQMMNDGNGNYQIAMTVNRTPATFRDVFAVHNGIAFVSEPTINDEDNK